MRTSIAIAAALTATAAVAADVPITTKTFDDTLVAYVRFEGQYADVPGYMGRLRAAVGEKDAGPYMALFYDGPEVPVHDIEICVPVTEAFEAGDVKTRTFPAGTYARTVHLGSYATAGDTWMRLGSFVQKNDLAAAGPGVEIYLTHDPKNEANNVLGILLPISRPVEAVLEEEGPSSRVIHFDIPADDPARAAAFYAGALGWKIEQWEDVDYWLCYTGTGDGIDGAIYKRSHPREAIKITAAVADFDAAEKALKEAGGKIVAPKVPVPGVGWLGYVVDSEGNEVGIMQLDPTAK
jgi:predicted enzyme related to lactoylglutathione lyase/effector-binding domain-containing protein